MKIAFTSCSNVIKQGDYQPIWGIIHGLKPDLLLLLGDNVYMGPGKFNASRLEKRYKQQLAEPHFNKLLCDVPYLAVWDNHDFGLNIVGTNVMTATQRRISRDLFNEYLKYRSKRPYTSEVYCTYTIGKVKVIMLDVRSYQQVPGNNKTLLGKCQEDWLIDEMHTEDHRYTLICSGLPYSYRQGGWMKYKNWFDRFNREVARAPKPIFLGGGIHKNYFQHHIVTGTPIIKSTIKKQSLPWTPWDANLYEAISSGVGINTENWTGIPRNNYGIIDFKESTVEITLYSQQPDHFFHRVINKNNWELVD